MADNMETSRTVQANGDVLQAQDQITHDHAQHQDLEAAQTNPNSSASPPQPALTLANDRLPRPLWKFTLLMLCLADVVFCAAIDQAIIAPALPTIGKQFGNPAQTPWVGSAFLLTSACASIFYGNIAVICGVRTSILTALALLTLGEIICAAAQSLVMLIVGRALGGLGGGGLIASALMSVAFLVPAVHLPRLQGLLGAVFALSAVSGPLLGGAFTTHATWRWCFIFKMPFIAIAAIGIFLLLDLPPPPPAPGSPAQGMTKWQRTRNLDWLGAAIILAGSISILLPIQSGGNMWAWDAPQTIALLIIGFLLLILFVVRCATTKREPVIPMQLFLNPRAVGLLSLSVCVGVVFYSLDYWVPQYFQFVDDVSAAQAGVRTLPLVLAVTFCTVATGFLIPYTGYTYLPYLGSLFGSIGLGLLTTLDRNSGPGKSIGFLIMCGFGTGLVVQTCIIGIQQAVKPELIAVATASNTFLQVLGGAFGVAMSGAILDSKLSACLAANVNEPGITASSLREDPSLSFTLPPVKQAAAQDCFTNALSTVWTALIPFAAFMSVAMTLCLVARAVLDRREAAAAAAAADHSSSSDEKHQGANDEGKTKKF